MRMRSSLGGSGSQWMLALMLAVVLAGILPTAAWAWSILGTASVQDALGVGTETPARQVHVRGENAVFRMDRDRDGPAFMLVETALGNFNSIWKTFVVSTIASGVNNGSFVINDLGTAVSGTGTRRLTIANNGLIGNVETPAAALHVRNPSTGNNLRLDSNGGTPNFYVQNDGDLYAIGADLELRLATSTSSGYSLPGGMSTLLANTSAGSAESAFLALNGDTAIISSPGDDGLLRIQNSGNNWINFRFNNESIEMGHLGDITIAAVNQVGGEELILSTTGEAIQFVADSDNNTAQSAVCTWHNNGSTAAYKMMELDGAYGNLKILGALEQYSAFDLAEAYWKIDAEIEAGDLVCIDPERPNAVVLARAANDTAVIGVISTAPGLIMGGGAFSVGNLTQLWGDDVAAQFAGERKSIEKKLAASDPYIKGRAAKLGQMKTALAKSAGSKDAAVAKAAYESETQQLADVLEGAALEAFCREHLGLVAMAGRVPVKVDASYGAIRAGHLLVASPTPGHAMRADNPAPQGAVVGKALEPFDAGQGSIMMMVLNR